MRLQHSRPGFRAILAGVTIMLSVASLADARAAVSQQTDWLPPVMVSDSGQMVAQNPVLLCDRNHNTHLFWLVRSDDQASVFYSTDSGGAWSAPTDILVSPTINLLEAVVTPNLRFHVVWLSANRGNLVYTSAPLLEAANPREWPNPRVLARGALMMDHAYGGGGALFADSTGVVHLLYGVSNDSVGNSSSLLYIRSEDDGNSWSQPVEVVAVTAPEPSGIWGTIAVDGAGRLHVAWGVRSVTYGAFSMIGYLRSIDGGKSWGDELELATSSTAPGVSMAAVFAFGQDEVHLTYDTPARMHRWSSDGGATWSQPVQVMDFGAAFGGFNKLARDSAGTLHVVSAVFTGVYHATWNGARWNPYERVDAREFDPHGQQLVVCQGNRLHVAYYDRTAETEVWYTSMTTGAPELNRTPIATEVAVSSAATATWTVPSTQSKAQAASTPQAVGQAGRGSAEAPRSSLPAALIGPAVCAIVMIGVTSVKLLRRR